MENLNQLRVFVSLAETLSFKETARKLGLTSSAVSKAMTRLEAEVGVRLFQRTTRSVGMTDEGHTFFLNCKQILGEIERAEHMLYRAADGPIGRLRVHMAVAFGRRVVMPAIAEFIEAHPGVTVSAEMSDRSVDLAYEGFDVDIRVGEIADARVVARKLCDLPFVACASAQYLKRHGEPKTPGELARHNCLTYAYIHSGRLRPWEFMLDGRLTPVTLSGNLQANNSESLLEAAASGLGIAMVSRFIAEPAIASGQVVPVLAQYATTGPPVHAVYLPSHQLSPKIRAFVNFLGERVGKDGAAEKAFAAPGKRVA